MSYAEALSIINKISEGFNELNISDDVRRIEDMIRKEQEVEHKIKIHKNELRKYERGQTETISEMRTSIANPESLKQKITQLKKQKISLEEEIKELNHKLEEEKKIFEKLNAEKISHDEEVIKKKREMKYKIPALKHRINLYHHVIPTEWNEIDENGKKIINGWIHLKQNKPNLVSFQYDTSEMNKFDLVNSLWELQSSCVKNLLKEVL